MFNRLEKLEVPKEFPFPFQPYKIQDEFMRAIYSVIENGKIGIFESPTGTGKTLSLMCGALKWLNDHNETSKKDLQQQIAAMALDIRTTEERNAKESNWLDGQYDSIQKKEALAGLKKQMDTIEDYHMKLMKMRENVLKQQKLNGKDRKNFNRHQKTDSDALFDKENAAKSNQDDEDEYVIEETEDLDEFSEDVSEQVNFRDTKILFCSRTHSQLSQVVHELKKTIYGRSLRIVSLGSRQQFCINPTVRALNSNALINELCLDMKKGKVKSSCCKTQQTQQDEGRTVKKSKVIGTEKKSCPFYTQTAVQALSQLALSNVNDSIMDIEELIEEAKVEKACPYYAARQAAKDAQVIMLPYQMLLHKKTRQQLDISIKDSIIIIDEAHNLLDTISNIHSAEISFGQLQRVHQHLNAYKEKYFARFSTKSLLRLNQLISIANRLVKRLTVQSAPSQASQKPASSEFTSEMIFVHELLDDANISTLTLYEILKFCEDTRLAQKLQGFVQRYGGEVICKEKDVKPKQTHATYLKKLSEQKLNESKSKKGVKKESEPNASDVKPEMDKVTGSPGVNVTSASVIRTLLNFLECLMEKSTDGRVLVSVSRALPSKSFIKYLLLNPSTHFAEFLQDCRTVIVAGGTMQPTTEFTAQLFRDATDRLEQHFFGHVVSSDAVLPICVSKGPRNSPFLFNFTNRGNQEMLADLSMTIQNICNVIPAGIVCFFASYDYMEQFFKYLTETKALEKIEQRKKVFKEPRSGGQQLDKILTEYGQAVARGERARLQNENNSSSSINGQNGALMLSVIGGKLSEGLNFSDALGRCVCVVGLPFPNKTNPELAEKMRYLDSVCHKERSKGGTNAAVGTCITSSEYYENLCMKAVNQSIGRAIRHINDYAAVLLIDERYQQDRIQQKLPEWIRTQLKCPANYGGVQGAVVKFFRQKRLASIDGQKSSNEQLLLSNG